MITDYRVVPNSWRKYVIPRDVHRNRRTTRPAYERLMERSRKGHKPIRYEHTKLLLENKTLLVPTRTTQQRNHTFAYLYRVAARRDLKLRVHEFQDIDKGILKGYLVWMEAA